MKLPQNSSQHGTLVRVCSSFRINRLIEYYFFSANPNWIPKINTRLTIRLLYTDCATCLFSVAWSVRLYIPKETKTTKKGISDIIIYAELNVEKVGSRRMDLLIHTRNRKANSITNRLLENKEVVYVDKNIGEYTIVWLLSK